MTAFNPEDAPRPRRRKAVGATVMVAAGLILGATGGFVASNVINPSSPSAATLGDGHPHIVTAKQLESMAPLVGVAYWEGIQANTQIELTVTSATVYVRYLPTDVAVGAKQAVLTVATYRNVAGYSSLTALGKDASVVKAQSGAVVAVKHSAPLSTYFAFPGGTFQVEVFAPRAGISLKNVDDGQITPIQVH